MSSHTSNVTTGNAEIKAQAVQTLKDCLKLTSIHRFLTASFDEDAKLLERRIFNAIYKLTKIGLTDREKRETNAIWFSFVGLSAQNIRHLELCSITDFNAVFSITNQELRSIADRGRLDVETKRKLLQSTLILHNHWNVVQGSSKRGSLEDTPSTSHSTTHTTPAVLTPNPNPTFTVPSLSVTGVKMIQSSSMGFGVASAPKSPKTASRLIHAIPHKWHRSTKFRFSGDAVCHFCQRPLGFGFLNAWEKCRSCKWKVHTQCKGRVGDSCGLTPDHLRFLFDKLIQENNGGMWKDPQSVPGSRSMNEPAFQFPDTAIDSSSSTNSSAPSTPALPAGISSNLNPLTAPYRSSERKFLFPDTEVYTAHNRLPILVITENDAPSSEQQTESGSQNELGTQESEGTVVAVQDSQDSQEAAPNPEVVDKFNKRADGGFTWERHAWNMSTIRGPNAQASWNEVTIQYDTIEFDRQAPIIGRGRFGKVFRGFHYGDVAIKFYDMEHISDKSKRAEEFKVEVSAYKNTRHDNIALFLGYFMSDEKYGMVLSLSRGSQSLYSLLHVVKEKLDLATSRKIAQQICQAVSYLHTKKILHKDLRTKNILIESKNKVVVTDYGVLSMKRLSFPKREYGYLTSKFWTSYISPELAMAMRTEYDEYQNEDFPFSESSDVYAFGVIWYEMLTGIMPFARDDAHRVIYAKSQGIRPCIPSIKCTPEMKDLLSACWSSNPRDRPTFSDINSKLTALPKKQRVNRSPSFPVMMKSYESTF